MSTLPPIVGFGVHTGRPGPVGPPARFAAVGRRLPVAAEIAGYALAGTVVTPHPTGVVAPVSGDGLVVLLAGELYHRDPLIEVVGADRAATDAELVLACCQRYGVTAFRLFNGRYAAVVLSARRVVVATDHAGSVPVAMRHDGHGVTVATELKVLSGAPGAHRVPAGTAMVFDLAGEAAPRAVRTWAPPHARTLLSPAVAVPAVADRLGAAVRARVGSPLGGADRGPTVVLSGGIDSSAVAAFAVQAARPVSTVTLGTDAGDEFAAARTVAIELGTEHSEVKLAIDELVGELPWAVAAAEIADPEILEYLLPLVSLYRRLPTGPQRILTGYGADIPLGGMHRSTEPLELLDDAIAADLAGYDGLNELSPLLSGIAGHWSTHPYWDREVLDLLVALEPGLKRRHGRDKWVLREAMRGLLGSSTVDRPKLGIHEGSGLTRAWSARLREAGVPPARVPAAKQAMATRLYRLLVDSDVRPDQVRLDDILAEAAL